MYGLLYTHSVSEEQLLDFCLLLLWWLHFLRLTHVYLQIFFAECLFHEFTSVFLLLLVNIFVIHCLAIEIRRFILVYSFVCDVKVVTQGCAANLLIFSLWILLIRLRVRLDWQSSSLCVAFRRFRTCGLAPYARYVLGTLSVNDSLGFELALCTVALGHVLTRVGYVWATAFRHGAWVLFVTIASRSCRKRILLQLDVLKVLVRATLFC